MVNNDLGLKTQRGVIVPKVVRCRTPRRMFLRVSVRFVRWQGFAVIAVIAFADHVANGYGCGEACKERNNC